MEFTKEYKEILSGGQEMTVKITATIEGKIADIKEPLHIVAEIPRRFAPNFYLALADRLSETDISDYSSGGKVSNQKDEEVVIVTPNIEDKDMVVLTNSKKCMDKLMDIGGFPLTEDGGFQVSGDRHKEIAPMYVCMFKNQPLNEKLGIRELTKEQMDYLRQFWNF